MEAPSTCCLLGTVFLISNQCVAPAVLLHSVDLLLPVEALTTCRPNVPTGV